MRTVAEVLAWWAVLTAAYATTLSVATTPELLVATLVGLICAVLAAAARRAARARWSPRPRWLTWLIPLAGTIVADTARLLSRLLHGRPSGGAIREIPVRPDAPPTRAAFRRAWGTVVLSASPGSVVVDWPAEGPLVLHELAAGGPALERRVTRDP